METAQRSRSRINLTNLSTESDQAHSAQDEDDPAEFQAALLECPQCKTTSLTGCYPDMHDEPSRLWPRPEKYLSSEIPLIVRNSFEEARVCFKAGAYSACLVDCTIHL